MFFAGGLAQCWRSPVTDAAEVLSRMAGAVLTSLGTMALLFGADARRVEGPLRETVASLAAKLLMLVMVMCIFPIWLAILKPDRIPFVWEVFLLVHLAFTVVSFYGYSKTSVGGTRPWHVRPLSR